MADFTSFKPSFSFPDFMDPNLDLMGHYSASNPAVLDNPTLNFTNSIPFSNDIFFPNQTPSDHHQLPQIHLGETAFPLLPSHTHSAFPPPNPPIDSHYDIKKRKSMAMDVSETTSGISTPQLSEPGLMFTTNNCHSGKGKRLKSIEKEEEKSTREVVHVRARRGQATDSHSLAERVRRGKINERLRCLKDIVPGCYKTMGMAVMLDEIINYVQSLQNQVEFLSMKLAAASSFYDFNTEADAISKLQRAKAHEAKELERLMREGFGGVACFHSTLPL